jgi:hypothetical protein
VTVAPFPVDVERLRVTAPTYEAACLLMQQLDRCHTKLVQDSAGSWEVTVKTSQNDGRALRATLSAIERWLCQLELGCTSVRVGEHDFLLSAGQPA